MSQNVCMIYEFKISEFSFAGWTDYTVGHTEDEDKYYLFSSNNKIAKLKNK